jgi:GDP-D-mannose dehydratase
VIGSGKAYRIADWLNIIFDYYKLDWTKYIEINENFKSEYEILVSDPSSIMQLGWSPKTDINELAKIMLDAAN